MKAPLRIALIAHDHKKEILIHWVKLHEKWFAKQKLLATGTTGMRIEKETKLKLTKLKSGPLGGDQQIGAMVAEGKLDWLIFFWDPLSPHPHEPDVKALIRIAAVYDIPAACNPSSADAMIEYFKLKHPFRASKRPSTLSSAP